MGKLGAAAVATGVGGTGAAGVYGAHSMGVFGGGIKAKSVSALTEVMTGEKASNANKCLQEIFKDGTIDSGPLPSLNTTFT